MRLQEAQARNLREAVALACGAVFDVAVPALDVCVSSVHERGVDMIDVNTAHETIRLIEATGQIVSWEIEPAIAEDDREASLDRFCEVLIDAINNGEAAGPCREQHWLIAEAASAILAGRLQ